MRIEAETLWKLLGVLRKRPSGLAFNGSHYYETDALGHWQWVSDRAALSQLCDVARRECDRQGMELEHRQNDKYAVRATVAELTDDVRAPEFSNYVTALAHALGWLIAQEKKRPRARKEGEEGTQRGTSGG